MATNAERIDDPTSVALGPGKGLLILGVVIVAVAAFIGLSHVVGLSTVFGGFLFILYFLGLCHSAPDKFLPAAVGAAGGLAITWMLVLFPAMLGGVGLVIPMLAIVAATYSLIMGWAPILVNNATMLFLTVGTIPALQNHAALTEMTLSTLLAITLVGGFMLLTQMRRRA
jgi:hypothetical protein